MKRYHIIVLIINLLLVQHSFGQITTTTEWDNYTQFDCSSTPNWEVTDWYRNVSVNCSQPGENFQANNITKVFYKVNGVWTDFPTGTTALKTTVGNAIEIRTQVSPTNRRREEHFRLVRFHGQSGNPSSGTFTEIVSERADSYGSHHETTYTFTEPGKYLFYVWGRFDKENSCPFGCEQLIRVAIGWVYVLPNVACPADNVGCKFSACYVGPDGVCPDQNCECEDVIPNPDVSETDYYWSGQTTSSDGLLYQAPLYARSPLADGTDAADAKYFWYPNSTSFNSGFLPHKNEAGKFAQNIDASEFPLKYRLTGPDNVDKYTESVYVRAARGGMFSDATLFTVERNLVPEPLYDVSKDCFGYSADFINTSVVEGSPTFLEYTWHFGDGATTYFSEDDRLNEDPVPSRSEWKPYEQHEFINSGVYYPVLQIRYAYEGCDPLNIFTKVEDRKEFNIEPIRLVDKNTEYKTTVYSEVLSTSAASFQDSWVMDLGGHLTKNEQNQLIRDLNPFVNGQRGLWRGEGAFSYIKDRLGVDTRAYDEKVNMRKDGTFELDNFNWKVHNGPGWVKANTITEYSAYGSEIENRDVLNRYSAAIFGYNGELSTAVGANMEQREMAFTGFEEEQLEENPPNSGQFTQVYSPTNFGNFNITNLRTVRLRKVPVLGGNKQVGILKYPFLKLENLRAKAESLTLSGFNIEEGGSFAIEDVELTCKFRDMRSPEQSIVRFSGAGLDALSATWQGELTYYETLENTEYLENEDYPVINSAVAEIVDNINIAHTGTRYLVVREDFEQPQFTLDLQEEKEYVISAWVRVNTGNRFDETYATEETTGLTNAQRLGIGIKNAAGDYLGMLVPSGNIIEGWQRIQGKFTFKEGSEFIQLCFQKGGHAEVMFDDMRFFSNLGNMQTYVYDRATYRLLAALDNNNFATLYSYDSEGNLFLIKKETIEGVKTIQESMSHQKGSDD